MVRLSGDLTEKLGRGFAPDNLQRMRAFYAAYPPEKIYATLSRKSLDRVRRGPLANLTPGEYLATLARAFPLSWSHYVRLLGVRSAEAREFYETEAWCGGWSVRQLDRQVGTLFFERTLMSRNKTAMLSKGARPRPQDRVRVEEEIKDPYILEFLGLHDEYSENDLEAALVRHLESFLLELGHGFTFVARQKRIRIGDTWYRIDLLLFHRRLRSLVIVDLKVGRFTHADAGQMNLYVNYATEHLVMPEENPPIGLILCSEPDAAVARYALDHLASRIVAAEYRLALPDVKRLEAEVKQTRRRLSLAQTRKGTDDKE